MNKKHFILPLALAVALASCQGGSTESTSEANEPAQSAVGIKIAYVELDSLMSKYLLYKDYEEVLTKKGTEIQATLAQKQRRLESNAVALQKKYESNGFTTRDELERAQTALQNEQMQLQQTAEKLNMEFNEEQERINQEARDSIQAFLKVYNKKKKFDYVMIKAGDNLLVANPKYNITNDIVNGLNKRYKSTHKADKK